MSGDVRWSTRALRDLKRLDATIQGRIVAAVAQLAQTGEGDVVRLVKVKPPEFRLRLGDWRVRFRRDERARLLLVLRVLHRSKAYR